ncbi:Proline--tRNA ligase [Bienertia sinuspersici]
MSTSENKSVDITNEDSNPVLAATKLDKDDGDNNINGSAEALAKGISTMLSSVIRDFDSKAEDASRSQNKLFSALDRLTTGSGLGFCSTRKADGGRVGWVGTWKEMVMIRQRRDLQLDQLLEDAPLPFIMQHATKLSNVRKRVSSVNLLLRSVQHRLDNIDRMISIGSHGM